MSPVNTAHWRIDPLTPPRPLRHCPTCGDQRPFRSSDRIRLNANGRRLDAWLIYRCETCDRTWNLPILERVAVSSVAEADLRAMHCNDQDFVRARAFDLGLIRPHCDRIDVASDVVVRKTIVGEWCEAWTALDLVIDTGVGARLDRVLAAELQLSRSALLAMEARGGLRVDRGTLRKPVTGRVTLRFEASSLTEAQRAILSIHARDTQD